jgi:hypothetical protein
MANIKDSILIGTTAEMPAASSALLGILYVDTAVNKIYRCNGSSWVSLSG